MTTLAFLSLFFGLIRGPFPVELAVNGPVATVELLVDGKSVQTLQAPPWKTTIDFGPDLLPHEIVARALDAKGAEIARIQEWANLPHFLAKVEILLEMDKLGPPKAARVVWTNLQGEKPTAISLVLDGLPLALDASDRASLPTQDLASLHVLTAEVTFPSRRTVRREIAYGGEYGSAVSTELTAVPVRMRRGDLPPVEKLAGWLTSGGKPLPVAAAEQGPKQLYVIAAPGSSEALAQILSRKRTRWNVDDAMKLGPEDRIRFVLPFPKRFGASGEKTDIFDISPEIETGRVGLLKLLLTSHVARIQAGSPMQIVDAAAVAGLEAVTENRRRAILVVLPGGAKDQSRFDSAMVRRYLAALRVPLFVWSLGRPESGSAAAAWGKVTVMTALSDLQRAYLDLRDNLDSQRILLVDGRLLPQSIALSPLAASRVELAGSVP
jgi:hypothetical protein